MAICGQYSMTNVSNIAMIVAVDIGSASKPPNDELHLLQFLQFAMQPGPN